MRKFLLVSRRQPGRRTVGLAGQLVCCAVQVRDEVADGGGDDRVAADDGADREGQSRLCNGHDVDVGCCHSGCCAIWRGALSAQVKKVHQTYYLPSMTGIATAIYENLASPPVAGEVKRHRTHMAQQLAGAERLQGTYPYTLARSVKAYRLNKFLHDMVVPAHREAFKRDEEASFTEAGLSEEEKALLRRRDWRGLIHYGCIFFGLEKFGAVVGLSNLHIYAAMRGESLGAFQKTRNSPVLYSVASTEVGKKDWSETR